MAASAHSSSRAMRLGVISDAHGNAPGLARCLAFLKGKGVDRVVHLGDAVGYLPYGGATAGLLERAGADCLLGNHEAMLWGWLPRPEEHESVIQLGRSGKGITAAWKDRVEAQGPRLEVDLGGHRVVMVHGSPAAPLTGRLNAPDDFPAGVEADVVLFGHTHRPQLWRDDGQLWLNPGSCGLPRDRGDWLSLAVLDLPSMEAHVFRLPFTPPPSLTRDVHPRVAANWERRDGDALGELAA